jgi:entericidin B
MSKFRSLLAIVLLALSAGALSACNTMEGAGEDMSEGGDAISDTADDIAD